MSKFCTNCGKKLLNEALFCEECGTHVPNEVEMEYVKKQNPMRKKIAIPILILIMAGLTTGVVFGKEAIMFKLSPENYAKEAIQSTAEKFAEDVEREKGMICIDSDKYGTQFGFVINDAYTKDGWGQSIVETSERAEFSLNIERDISKKMLMASMDTNYKGEDFCDINLYFDQENVAIALPQLCDYSFVFSAADFGKKWNETEWENMMSVPDDFCLDFDTVNKLTMMKFASKETKKKYSEAVKLALEDLTILNSQEEKLQGDTALYKCRVLEVEFDTANFEDGISQALGVMSEDEQVQLFDSWAEIIGGYDESNRLKDLFDDNIEITGAEGKLYIYKGRVVSYTLDISTEVDDSDEINVSIENDILGEKSIFDNYRFNVTIEAYGDEYDLLQLKKTGNHSVKKDTYSDETEISMSNGYDDLTFEISTKIEFDSKEDDNLTFDARFGESNDYVTLEGTGTYQKSKDLIKINMSNMDLEYQNGDNLCLNFSSNYSTTTDIAKKPNVDLNKAKDAFSMSYDEIHDELSQIGEHIEELPAFLEWFI